MVQIRNSYVVTIVAMAIALTITAGVAQSTKRTQTAVISADTLVYDWDSDVFEFIGNCKVKIVGATEATLSAPKMIVKLSAGGNAIEELQTVGKTELTILTAPNDKGQRRYIEAHSNSGATYDERSRQIVLTGGAVADMTMRPPSATERIQTVHFTGQQITADLKAATIKAKQVHVEVTGSASQAQQGQ